MDGHPLPPARLSAKFLVDPPSADRAVHVCSSRSLGGVHFVAADDHLLDSERVREQRVFARLSVLRDARLELARAARDHQHRAVRLRRTSDHVLKRTQNWLKPSQSLQCCVLLVAFLQQFFVKIRLDTDLGRSKNESFR